MKGVHNFLKKQTNQPQHLFQDNPHRLFVANLDLQISYDCRYLYVKLQL